MMDRELGDISLPETGVSLYVGTDNLLIRTTVLKLDISSRPGGDRA